MGWCTGLDLSKNTRMAGRKSPLSLKARAIALLAQREHSVAELRRKLLRLAQQRDWQIWEEAQQPVAHKPASREAQGIPGASSGADAGDPTAARHAAPEDLRLAEHRRVGSFDLDEDWVRPPDHADAHSHPRTRSEPSAHHRPAQPDRPSVHSRQALSAVLDEQGHQARAEEVELLLQWLQQRGYLSESRLVESRINARAARYGNLRIRQELKQLGVAPDEEQQARLKESELERAREVWRRKFGGEMPADAASRAKQMRFLAARGFSSDVVRQVLRAEGEQGDAAELEC